MTCGQTFGEMWVAEQHEATCTGGAAATVPPAEQPVPMEVFALEHSAEMLPMEVFARPFLHSAFDGSDDEAKELLLEGLFSSETLFWDLDQELVDWLLEQFNEVDVDNSGYIDSEFELKRLSKAVAHKAFTKFGMEVTCCMSTPDRMSLYKLPL